jgi:hypothetical protein
VSRTPVDLTSGTLLKKKKQRDSVSIVLKAFNVVEEKQKYTEGHNPICDLLRESPLKHPTGFLTPWEDRSNFLLRALSVLIEEESNVIIFGGGLLFAGQDTCFFKYQLNKRYLTCHGFTQLLLNTLISQIVRYCFLLVYLITKG